jgi:hypothetical protein
LNGVCASFRGKAKIQNKITRIAQRYNKQKGIELIYVQIKMKLNGLVIVSVNTIAATEFRTSNYCHLKKNDVVHALLKLVF